jgi:hypothetical protein
MSLAGHAMKSDGQGVGRIVGFDIGRGNKQLADQRPGFLFLVQVGKRSPQDISVK